jgi:hypothetical protein
MGFSVCCDNLFKVLVPGLAAVGCWSLKGVESSRKEEHRAGDMLWFMGFGMDKKYSLFSVPRVVQKCIVLSASMGGYELSFFTHTGWVKRRPAT